MILFCWKILSQKLPIVYSTVFFVSVTFCSFHAICHNRQAKADLGIKHEVLDQHVREGRDLRRPCKCLKRISMFF